MKSSKPCNQEPPDSDLGAVQPLDEASRASGQVPPVQSGSQYGGYGQSEAAFGRDAGSSSEEGGQGSSEESTPANSSAHAPSPGGIDDGRRASPETSPTGRKKAGDRGRPDGTPGDTTGPRPSQR